MPSTTSHTPKLQNTTYVGLWPARQADRLPVSASVLVITGLSGGLWWLIVQGFIWVIS